MNPTQNPATHDGVPLSDYLRGAATYLGTRGWVQRQLFADTTDPFPPADIAGALIMAIYGRRVDLFTSTDLTDTTGPAHETWESALLWLEDHLGLRAHRRAQHLVLPGDLLFAWHDDPSRTAAEVLAALRDAADIYDGAAAVVWSINLAEKPSSQWTDADLAAWLSDDDVIETYAQTELDQDRNPTWDGLVALMRRRMSGAA
ncbi:hypothetical protein AB0K00_40095 [Dactylosporangium sp. NPDC049525]|uniref:DUF6197 family protein n=1 Tax=Dactylosporangium sp. NPDC049525 TaxID=3154730 RepID=UPI003434BCC2